MEAIKKYTPNQLASAEVLMKKLSSLSDNEKRITVMMANAFMEGMAVGMAQNDTKNIAENEKSV